MTTTRQTTTDPLGEWFRHIGTKLSDTDYEAGIKALSWARDQFHPTRTNPTDAEIQAAAEEAEQHEQWGYDENGFPHCECGASLVESKHTRSIVPPLMAHQARAALDAARKASGR